MAAIRARRLTALAFVASLSGCRDSGTGRVDLQLSTRATMPMSAASAARPRFSVSGTGQATIDLGGDQIVIDQVELVLRKIKFEGVGAGSCDAVGGTAAEGETENCGEFRAGPELFDLPLDPGVLPTFTATVPVGSYHEVQLQIHRPTNANEDAAFLTDHPDFAGTSIRLTGTYQKAGDPAPVPFTYTTDLTSVLNIELERPIDVADGAEVGVTLSIDLSGWFADVGGSGLVNPAEALDGQPLESRVEQNIRSSFHVFEDEDADGAAD